MLEVGTYLLFRMPDGIARMSSPVIAAAAAVPAGQLQNLELPGIRVTSHQMQSVFETCDALVGWTVHKLM